MSRFFHNSRRRVIRLQRRRATQLASLGFNDWCVLTEALATLAVVEIALRAMEFPRVLSWAKRSSTIGSVSMSQAELKRVAWLLGAASRLAGLRCLTQSVALLRLLSRRGVVADLCIGVRTENGRLEAHAWVECMGRAVNDNAGNLQRFAAFDRAIGENSNV